MNDINYFFTDVSNDNSNNILTRNFTTNNHITYLNERNISILQHYNMYNSQTIYTLKKLASFDRSSHFLYILFVTGIHILILEFFLLSFIKLEMQNEKYDLIEVFSVFIGIQIIAAFLFFFIFYVWEGKKYIDNLELQRAQRILNTNSDNISVYKLKILKNYDIQIVTNNNTYYNDNSILDLVQIPEINLNRNYEYCYTFLNNFRLQQTTALIIEKIKKLKTQYENEIIKTKPIITFCILLNIMAINLISDSLDKKVSNFNKLLIDSVFLLAPQICNFIFYAQAKATLSSNLVDEINILNRILQNDNIYISSTFAFFYEYSIAIYQMRNRESYNLLHNILIN